MRRYALVLVLSCSRLDADNFFQKDGKTGAKDTEDDSDASSLASNDSDATSSSGSSEDEGGAPTGTTDIDDISSKVPADEVILKRRRLSNASQRSVASTKEAAKAEEKKSKKSEKNKDTAAETEDQDEKPQSVEKDTKKSKKAEKKRKRTSDAAETEEPSVKKDKKEKKTKSKKSTTEESSAAKEEGEQWQVEDLDGGASRQQKFLRLLGGKKAGTTGVGAASHVSKGKSDSTKAEADIQRQFEVGMKMKAEGGSKRRGLGA